MRFEERDLTREVKGYAEPVLPDHLREGEVYFAVVFLDKDSLVPTMEPRVFVGTKAESDGNKLYFQDFVPTSVGFGSSHRMLTKKRHLSLGQGATSSSMRRLLTFSWRAL